MSFHFLKTFSKLGNHYGQRLLAEALGTFALVLVGCGSVMVNVQTNALGLVGIAIAFGLVVTAVVYAIGHLSGAHINPAVTVGFATIKRFPWNEVPGYIAAQCVGALAASACLYWFFGPVANLAATAPTGSVAQSLVMEFVITAILMFVIVGVATDERATGHMTGIVAGATVVFLVLLAGPISGASLNPARSFAPALLTGQLAPLWIYIVGPIAGGTTGAVLYELVRHRRQPEPSLSDTLPPIE